MKITKTIELKPDALKTLIISALGLPDNSRVSFNVGMSGYQRDEYYTFTNATVSVEEEFGTHPSKYSGYNER